MTGKLSFADVLPISETGFYILLALSEPRSGRGISEYITRLTNGRIKPGPGTVYNALCGLCRRRIIDVYDDSGRRVVYDMTDKGRELLSAGERRIKAVSRDVGQAAAERQG